MATTLEEILGYRNLTGIIQDPRGGVPADILPPGFTRSTRGINGHTCTYRKVSGTRDVARIAHYGSPSQVRQLKNIADVPIKLLHTVENITHDVTTLTQLENYDNPNLQKLGRDELARQTREFQMRFNALRVSTIYSTLRHGAVYFDGDGKLLVSSGGAVTTVDWGVPAGNKDQLDILGDGSIIGTKWDDAAATIIKDIGEIKSAALKKSGYPLKYAFYGSALPEYIATNTIAKNLINGNAALSQGFAAGGIPNGFAGLNWVPIADAFFADVDTAGTETFRTWYGDDIVTFTPEPSPEWWEVIEGTYAVPRNMNMASDGAAAASSFAIQRGMFSFAHPRTDPSGIKHVAGDTFIGCLKVPNAIMIADTSF